MPGAIVSTRHALHQSDHSLQMPRGKFPPGQLQHRGGVTRPPLDGFRERVVCLRAPAGPSQRVC